jgi:HSP20 family molecular chaperone IbpA
LPNVTRTAAFEGNFMSRASLFSSPLLLGFDQLERLLDQATKAGDTFPPYNIERFPRANSQAEGWRITLAVAGFSKSDLQVSVVERQLAVKGRLGDDGERDFLHRGIAGRAFNRSFVLAEGMEVSSAFLQNGLLSVELIRLEPEPVVTHIEIEEK